MPSRKDYVEIKTFPGMQTRLPWRRFARRMVETGELEFPRVLKARKLLKNRNTVDATTSKISLNWNAGSFIYPALLNSACRTRATWLLTPCCHDSPRFAVKLAPTLLGRILKGQSPTPTRNCCSAVARREQSHVKVGQSGCCQFQVMNDRRPFYRSYYGEFVSDK